MILKKPLGQIMAEREFITRQQLNEALQRQKRINGEKLLPEQTQRVRLVSEVRRSLGTDKAPLLGEILADMGFATKEQLEETLGEQDKSFEVYKSLEKEKLGIVIETGSLLNSTLNLAEVLDLIMRYANQVTNSVASTLMLIDDKTGELVFSIPTGPKADKLTDIRIPRGKGIAGWVAEHEQPVLITNAQDDSRFYPEIDKLSGFKTKAILCVPLKAKTRLIGVLEVINKVDGTSFAEEDIQLLNIFGHQAAVAIENAKLHTELADRLEERKEAEEALRESEEKYRTILESIEDGYFEVDIAGNFTFFNDSLCKIFGYSKDELMGMNNRQYTDEENAKELYQTFNTVYTTGKPDKGYDWEIIRKDGSKRYVEASVSLRKDSEGQPIGFRGIARDVSERRQAEEEKARLEVQLQQAQKMEAIGTLAGGIAHDFNNLMTSVLGNISLAKMEMKPESKGFKNLVEAEDASIQTKELTARLITFSKGGEPVKETVSIGDLVKGAVGSSLKSSDIDAGFSIPDDISPVEADEEQMKQVIHNVVTNAQEAMAGQGSINVSCENIDIGEKDTLTLKDGQYVKISIEDQGPGIPEEDLIRIFDPYFSTKEMGTQKGMGLGLAVSDSIVKKHDGLITVESELGRGTTLSIYLPAGSAESQAPGARRLEVDSQSTIVNRQSTIQRVLVMDDEEMVRKVIAALLGHIGYEVELAVDGVEAIEMYKGAMESGKAYEAVILDLTNKVGMGGVEAIERLLKIDPDVKAVVATGYSSDPILSNFREHGFCGSLSKPFTLDELKTTLSEVVAIE